MKIEVTPPAVRPFIVVNPLSRRASTAIAEIVRQARRAGLDAPRSVATTPDDPGARQAREAIEAGADLVIVIGGDGTVREVVRELAGTSTRLAIIALGSGNVLAHNFGITQLDLAAQVEVALRGPSLELDLGWARLVDASGGTHLEPFCTMAGIGRDARAVADTDTRAKLRFGWAAYALAGMREALRSALPMRVQVDDEPPRHVDTWTVLAGLTPGAPGGITIHPDVELNDGLFDILEVPIKHVAQWLPVAIKGLWQPGRKVSALRYSRGERLRVQPDEPQPVQLDGDVFTDVTSLDAVIEPRCLRVHVPASKEQR